MKVAHASALAVAASLSLAAAQTSTSCNPTSQSCPSDTGLNSGTYTADFTSGSGANASWTAAAYTTINYGSQGAEFTIKTASDAPTVQTNFYFLFGRVDVKMKAAPGTGIVSSIVLESDDLDEIDLEFLGGDTTQVETNFFGKGNTTAYDRAVYYNVQTPQSTFHTYSVDWNSDRIEFIIDGTTVRTISSTDPLTLNGKNYPQTPMRVKLGNWAGGGPSEPQGTIEWAGGPTDFTKGPFVMYVESVSVQNNNPACSYSYGDESGTWQSIKMNKSGCAQGFSGAASSSSSGSASNSANQTSASGSASAAPMSNISVAPISVNSGAAVTSTVTGSSYSVNSASASAQNSNGVMATTEVPGSSPTSNSGSNTTGSSSGPAKSTSSSGSTVVKSCVAAGSLVGAAVAFFML